MLRAPQGMLSASRTVFIFGAFSSAPAKKFGGVEFSSGGTSYLGLNCRVGPLYCRRRRPGPGLGGRGCGRFHRGQWQLRHH
eukprot:235312-Pyramimonas_sp.AAC.1